MPESTTMTEKHHLEPTDPPSGLPQLAPPEKLEHTVVETESHTEDDGHYPSGPKLLLLA
jgi:hypothetical protein